MAFPTFGSHSFFQSSCNSLFMFLPHTRPTYLKSAFATLDPSVHSGLMFSPDTILRLTYLDLVPPVPLGASGNEKSPSITVAGDPAGSMPTDTHLFQVFFECTLPSVFYAETCPSVLWTGKQNVDGCLFVWTGKIFFFLNSYVS